MTSNHYDALVVGSGPAGSVAALVLARGGARVALVDKSDFPRDKACGDLVGPRGVQTLSELGIHLSGRRVGDMDVIGPTGRRVRLPAQAGSDYPGHAVVVRRLEFDARLRDEAVAAGAIPYTGRYSGAGIELVKGGSVRLTADVVIGADGALSRVAAAAGLVNEEQAIWGFAIRAYLAGELPLPRIHFWEPARWAGYPGYGWDFPGVEGSVNIGLGVAHLGDRRPAARAVRDLPRFVTAAGHLPEHLGPTLGGWLKLGMIGTVPAAGRTLLVGDAAGLVNSLQGEGIAQAMGSGRLAAKALLEAGPDRAAACYLQALASRYAPYAASTAPLTAWLLERPIAVAGLGRLLTAPALGKAVAGGWGVYWNDLLEGCQPGWSRQVARLAALAGRGLTTRSASRRRLEFSLQSDAFESHPPSPPPPDHGPNSTGDMRPEPPTASPAASSRASKRRR